MDHLAHGGMDRRMTEKAKPMPKEVDHLRMHEAANDGHIIEHHFTHFEHSPEQHVFPAMKVKVKLPKGHILQHVAEHMGIPHSVIEGKNESADKTDAQANEPGEEEEIEHEMGENGEMGEGVNS